MSKDALLEILSEEIPASYIEPARIQLAEIAEKIITEKRLKFKKISTVATSRRLVLYVENLSEKQDNLLQEIIGPSVNVAFDSAGRALPPALGFAQSHNVVIDSLSRKKMEKGEYLCLRMHEEGQLTEKIIPTIFIQIITAISFPKTMVWEETKVRFARPIRNLLTLYGNKVIKFSFAGINSGKHTYGLSPLVRKKINISQPARYFTLLRNNFVIVDQKERKETIKKLVSQIAKKTGGEVYFDSQLLDELTYLVEYPTAILGSFSAEFLNLPKEIVYTCLIKKQKFFPLISPEGKLLPYFVGVRNGLSEHLEIVQEGYQRVLLARLNDAQFFFNYDRKTSLIEKVERLKGITFVEQLGTIYEKIIRINELATWLAEKLKISAKGAAPAGGQGFASGEENEKLQIIQKICYLAKADLVTEIVKEYPELQGIAGRIYALLDGEKKAVAEGIEEHLLPLTGEGKLPTGEESALVSIADKIDTLVGDFALGLIPTGSADPYGLRRQTTGVLRIMKEKNWSFSLNELVEKSWTLLPAKVQTNSEKEKSVNTLLNFFRNRLETLLTGEKFRDDEINAVLTVGFDNVPATFLRANALKEIRQLPEFEPLVIVFKRAANILMQAKKSGLKVELLAIKEELFKEEAEKELWKKFLQIREEVIPLLTEQDFIPGLKKLVFLREPIDRFFNEVMVMSEDTNLRGNRLVLLANIISLYFKIANFSLLNIEKN